MDGRGVATIMYQKVKKLVFMNKKKGTGSQERNVHELKG